MLRLILASFMTLTTLLNLGCFNNSDTAPSDRSQVVGKLKLYTFSPDHKYFLGYAQPFILPPNTSISDTVDNLGQYLAENYFFKTYTSKLTRIHFEVLSIDEISTPARPLRIAVVNMVDTDSEAMSFFFQGSTGGQTTFCMLAATSNCIPESSIRTFTTGLLNLLSIDGFMTSVILIGFPRSSFSARDSSIDVLDAPVSQIAATRAHFLAPQTFTTSVRPIIFFAEPININAHINKWLRCNIYL